MKNSFLKSPVSDDRCGMQPRGGGVITGNTMNTEKTGCAAENNVLCKNNTSLRPTGRTSRLPQASSSHLHIFTQSAFTLIELLVVIAIIAILAAMLMPALSKARDRGKLSFCSNNIKQLGMGSQQYAMTYNDLFPAYWVSEFYYRGHLSKWSDYGTVWLQSLMAGGFVKDKKISKGGDLYCPAEQNREKYTHFGLNMTFDSNGRASSKTVKAYNWNIVKVGSRALWFKWTTVRRPSFVMLAGDSVGSYWIDPVASGNGAGGIGTPGTDFVRHNGVINGVFVDGHAENIPLALMPGPWDDAGRKTKPYL